MLPKPGEGPSPEQRAKAFFKMTFIGETASGKLLATSVSGGDPGETVACDSVRRCALRCAGTIQVDPRGDLTKTLVTHHT